MCWAWARSTRATRVAARATNRSNRSRRCMAAPCWSAMHEFRRGEQNCIPILRLVVPNVPAVGTQLALVLGDFVVLYLSLLDCCALLARDRLVTDLVRLKGGLRCG